MIVDCMSVDLMSVDLMSLNLKSVDLLSFEHVSVDQRTARRANGVWWSCQLIIIMITISPTVRPTDSLTLTPTDSAPIV